MNFAPDVTSKADILNGQVSGHPVCYMSTPFDNIYSPIAAQSYNMVTGVLGSANASDTYRRQRPALYMIRQQLTGNCCNMILRHMVLYDMDERTSHQVTTLNVLRVMGQAAL